jgi:hypothetical protein
MTAGESRAPTREYRAAMGFIASSVFVLLVLAWGAAPGVPPVGRLVHAFGPALSATVLLLVAAGLAVRRAWAVAAMTPLLWLLVIGGAIAFGLALAQGTLQLPIGALLAAWALRAKPLAAPAPAGRAGFSGRGLVVLAVVAAVWPLAAPVLTQPGGPFVAAASDLDASVEIDGACVDTTREGAVAPVAGMSAEAPATVDVTLKWSWRRTEVLREGIDAVIFEWHTMVGRQHYEYFLGRSLPAQAGVTEEDRFTRMARYHVDLAQHGFEPGAITIRLMRPSEAHRGNGSIELYVSYVHAPHGSPNAIERGLWTRLVQARCEW